MIHYAQVCKLVGSFYKISQILFFKKLFIMILEFKKPIQTTYKEQYLKWS